MSKSFSDLHRAALNNSVDLVQRLVEGGADMDEVDILGRTPLYWACHCLKPAVVESLLRHNADIDIVDSYGRTALQLAMSRPVTSPNRVAVLQLMATCAQTRLEASSAEWNRLARNERHNF